MPMSASFSGGCACGAIRYECSADPFVALNCHCRACQQASGSAYAAVVLVPAAPFTLLKGTPTYYRVTGDSGNPVDRGFCSACGSPLVINETADPGHVILQAASLDDPGWVRPVVDIFTSIAQPWDYLNPALPKFERSPPEDQIK